MNDETKEDPREDDPEPPEKPLERPTTDTKLISDMVVTDAAAAIRDALGTDRGDVAPSVVGAAVQDRLGTVEERLERLADLEDRFTRIEKAIDELRSKLDGDDE